MDADGFGFYDGRSADLTSGMPAGLMPMVSDNWTKLFTRQGVGPMPEAERAKLQAYALSLDGGSARTDGRSLPRVRRRSSGKRAAGRGALLAPTVVS